MSIGAFLTFASCFAQIFFVAIQLTQPHLCFMHVCLLIWLFYHIDCSTISLSWLSLYDLGLELKSVRGVLSNILCTDSWSCLEYGWSAMWRQGFRVATKHGGRAVPCWGHSVPRSRDIAYPFCVISTSFLWISSLLNMSQNNIKVWVLQ